jgi:hypothetical protein
VAFFSSENVWYSDGTEAVAMERVEEAGNVEQDEETLIRIVRIPGITGGI